MNEKRMICNYLILILLVLLVIPKAVMAETISQEEILQDAPEDTIQLPEITTEDVNDPAGEVMEENDSPSDEEEYVSPTPSQEVIVSDEGESAMDVTVPEGEVTPTETPSPSVTEAPKIYKITFLTNDGSSSKTLKALTIEGTKGSKVKLPSLPKRKGYVALGWTDRKNGITVYAKAKSVYTITGNQKLYLLYKKYYRVKFYSSNGSASGFSSLNLDTKKSSKITLPKLPSKAGYKKIGWSKSKKSLAADYQQGQAIKVKKNLKLYAVYRKNGYYLVQFFKSDKKEYKARGRLVKGNTTLTLPSIASPEGYTFLGWSSTPGKSSYPKYLMGQTVTVTGNQKFYAVLKKRPINTYTNAQLKFSKQYSTVIFLGDSRTVGLKNTMIQAKGSNTHIRFFCQSGVTIEWYRQNREAFLAWVKSIPGKKAIVFNFGVNNLRYTTMDGYLNSIAGTYARIMNQTAAALSGYNCSMYFMSVNPLNNAELVSTKYGGKNLGNRPPQWVRTFNTLLRSKLSGFQYIDTYTYLTNTGYESSDGLHYSDATYRKIYYKTLSIIDG